MPTLGSPLAAQAGLHQMQTWHMPITSTSGKFGNDNLKGSPYRRTYQAPCFCDTAQMPSDKNESGFRGA